MPVIVAGNGIVTDINVFTVAPENVTRLPKKVDGAVISRIGEITDQPGSVKITEQNHVWDLRPEGFEHFPS